MKNPTKILIYAGLGAVAILFHLLYSPLGFNPTDDGLVLSGARRILDGQFPHRDFISIRPVGSHLLHMPLLWVFGPKLLLASRLVFWLQLLVIVICWLEILRIKSPLLLVYGGISAVMLTAHSFPAMAWHSIDGIFLCSIGLLLIFRQGKTVAIGYLFLGLSVLFRQNLLLFGLLALALRRDERIWINATVLFIPTILYATVMAVGVGLKDCIHQLGIYPTDELFKSLFRAWFLNNWFLGGILFGLLIALVHQRKPEFTLGKHIKSLALWLVLDWLFLSLFFADLRTFDAIQESAFLWFGLLLGYMVYAYQQGSEDSRLKEGLLFFFFAWVGSISLGYNSPVLYSGLALLWLLREFESEFSFEPSRRLQSAAIGVLMLVLMHSFHQLRRTEIYREADWWALNERVDDLLPGTHGIRTNSNMRMIVEDLVSAIGKSDQYGDRHVVVPHWNSDWFAGDHPLAICWPQNTELGRGFLDDELLAKSKLDGTVFILQKFDMRQVAEDPIPDVNPMEDFVFILRRDGQLVDSTDRHELYLLN